MKKKDKKIVQGFDTDEFKKANEGYEKSKKGKDVLMKDILNKPIKLAEKESEKDLIKYSYKSKKGFVNTKVNRGFTEIEYLYNLIKDNDLGCFICGGYARYMASPLKNPYKAGDVDVYSYTKKDYKKLLSLLKKNKVNGKKYKLKIKYENEVSITLDRPEKFDHPLYIAPNIQLIKPFSKGKMVLKGNTQTIIENFDFTVVRCGLINENEVMVDADFDYDEKKKLLRIKNIHCPVSSVIRSIKYGKKGYWMTPMESIRLFLDWDNRDDDYRENLIKLVDTFNKNGVTKEELNELESLMRID